jgi:MerR family transcriptional regulator, copper efflux regulator
MANALSALLQIDVNPADAAPSAPLRIGELAKRTGVATSALRFYEQAGLLPEAERSAGGYRLYSADAVLRVQIIQVAQSLGLPLASVRQLYASPSALASTALAVDKSEVLASIDARTQEVDKLMAGLTSQRQRLMALRETLTRTWANGECVDPALLAQSLVQSPGQSLDLSRIDIQK